MTRPVRMGAGERAVARRTLLARACLAVVAALAAGARADNGAAPAGRGAVQVSAGAPYVVFITGDDEYRSEITMPLIAGILERRHGMRTSVAFAAPRPQTKDNIEGLEALETADLMVMFTRFRALPEPQLRRILAFTASGRPLIGLRTTTHAFLYPEGSPHRALNEEFGETVFGQKWITHHGSQSSTRVTLHGPNRAHPILRGVTPFHARSWLYHVTPLHGGRNTVLLEGTSEGSNRADKAAEFPLTQPIAWTRQYKGAPVFFTTLGHPQDFAHESMRRLLVNAVLWALGGEVPPGGADVTIEGTYTAPETFDLSKVQD